MGAGVCPLVVLLADSVLLSGLVVTLLVALGVAGLVVASWTVRPAAVVLGGWLGISRVLEVWGRSVEPGPEDMAFRIQSLSRVTRA